MNEIVNRFSLAGDKFMPEMQLKQPSFTYSACGPSTKSKERIQKFMLIGNTDYIYRNDLDKACFQHDMAYSKYKNKRPQPDKVVRNKAFESASNPKYDGYQRGLASMVTSFLIKGLLHLQINLLKVVELNQINNLKMNFINQILESLFFV